MKIKKLIQFGFLFLVLAGFSLVSIGAIQSEKGLIIAVSAAKGGNPNTPVIQTQDDLFEDKVLRFLKQEKVCSLTDEQISIVKDTYSVETKTYTVNGEDLDVYHVSGNPLNKNILERTLGTTLDTQCQVVHGNKVIAVLSPIFVS